MIRNKILFLELFHHKLHVHFFPFQFTTQDSTLKSTPALERERETETNVFFSTPLNSTTSFFPFSFESRTPPPLLTHPFCSLKTNSIPSLLASPRQLHAKIFGLGFFSLPFSCYFVHFLTTEQQKPNQHGLS